MMMKCGQAEQQEGGQREADLLRELSDAMRTLGLASARQQAALAEEEKEIAEAEAALQRLVEEQTQVQTSAAAAVIEALDKVVKKEKRE
jgi:hypothetical protein